MKITLLSDDALRLELNDGTLSIVPGGDDVSYSPFHMLASSLASCTFSVMAAWAETTSQQVDDLVIEVRWVISDDEPRRVSEIHLTYDWPSLPAKKQDSARRVAALCTIHQTLHTPPLVTTEPMHAKVG
jgi:putative redox protein